MSAERREESARLGERETAALVRARLVALDVDGVLTDGRVNYVGDVELLSFSVRDGAAITWLRRAGLRVVWITGRGSVAARRRAAELGVDALRTEVRDKRAALAELQVELGIEPDETIAMGDDLQDLGLAARAGLFVAPADACPEVCARAAIVTVARGGAGAVRELAELVLKARGVWDELCQRYGPAP